MTIKSPLSTIFLISPLLFAFAFVKLPYLFYINTSPSAPLGIYIISFEPIDNGDYCLLGKNDVPVQLKGLPQTILKRVAFCRSEYIEINDEGVFADGKFICNRPIKNRVHKYFYSGRLKSNECLLLNDNPDSFDSRHFGPVSIECLSKVNLLLKF